MVARRGSAAVNKDIATTQAETLRTWAEQWSRDGTSGSDEVAFLLSRVARLMGKGAIEEPLPPPATVETVSGD